MICCPYYRTRSKTENATVFMTTSLTKALSCLERLHEIQQFVSQSRLFTFVCKCDLTGWRRPHQQPRIRQQRQWLMCNYPFIEYKYHILSLLKPPLEWKSKVVVSTGDCSEVWVEVLLLLWLWHWCPSILFRTSYEVLRSIIFRNSKVPCAENVRESQEKNLTASFSDTCWSHVAKAYY